MGEIMRWRVTRLAQRRIPRPETILSLKGPLLLREPLLNGAEAALAEARAEYESVLANGAALRRYLSTVRGGAQTPKNPTLTAAVSNVFVNLLVLDEWLAAATPLPPAIPPFTTPAVADLQNEIDTLHLTREPGWADLWQVLADLYYLALLFSAAGDGFVLIEALGLLTRWLLVMGLVDAVKGIPGASGTVPSPVNTPDDVYAALRWRTPLLPDAVTAALLLIRDQRRAVVVRKPGFADLYITREEWDHYEAAEIASIENILAGELKSRVHELVNQTTVTTTTDQTVSTLKEQDTTTTDLSQLQQQSSSDISLAAHIDGQVDTVGQYGPTQVSTHLGGSLDFSSASATSRATTQSHETVARSVSKIEQTTTSGIQPVAGDQGFSSRPRFDLGFCSRMTARAVDPLGAAAGCRNPAKLSSLRRLSAVWVHACSSCGAGTVVVISSGGGLPAPGLLPGRSWRRFLRDDGDDRGHAPVA